MLINLPQTDGATPLYLRLIKQIKQQIHSGKIAAGEKMPSLRRLAKDLGVSRTTAEAAYNQLVAEGYLLAEPKRGYFAAGIAARPAEQKTAPEKAKSITPVRYDFGNNYIDSNLFPAAIWKRCLGHALENAQLLAGYGDPQGEPYLRSTLARYSHEARDVICTPEQIVIGAGIQSLLEILLAIFAKADHAVAFEEPGFTKAEQIFKTAGWQVSHFDSENLRPKLPQLLYISPSNPYKGRSLSPQGRLNLLQWARQTGGYILEDDYNGEFRYFTHPIASLQGMGGGQNVIYCGSFSRILLPSLRISYLVLPQSLLPAYSRVKHLYNQTSSSIEQFALAEFIASGNLRRHIKKMRRRYAVKNTLLRSALAKIFGNKISIMAYESGLHIRLAVHTGGTAQNLAKQALAAGIHILPVAASASGTISKPQTNYPNSINNAAYADANTATPEILLSFAGIAENDIEPALKKLQEVWKL